MKKEPRREPDYALILVTFLLLGIGLIMVCLLYTSRCV